MPKHNTKHKMSDPKQHALITSATMPRSLVILFATASAISVANVYYAQPLLDTLAVDFSISPATIGIVITAIQVGCALSLILLVPLGDIMNRRHLMLMQLAALVVALIATGLVTSTLALLTCMLAIGLLGTAMTQGLIAYAAAAATPTERGQVVGAAQGGVVIGLLLARVVAGGVADLAGWRGVYFFSAAIMLVLAAILWRLLPEQTRPLRQLSYAQLIFSMFSLLRHERVLYIRGGIALLMFAVFNIFWTALVLLLSVEPYNFSHTIIGSFGLVGVVSALAAAKAGYWADRGLGEWISGLALLILFISWLAIWLTTSSLWFLVIGIIALDLGGQAIHVTNQTMIFSTKPEAHSRLVGCYMLFYSVGSGLGAITSTAAFAAYGWSGVCLLGACVSLAALVFWATTLVQMQPQRT